MIFFEILFLVELPLPYIRLKKRFRYAYTVIKVSIAIQITVIRISILCFTIQVFCYSNILLLKQIVVAVQQLFSYRNRNISSNVYFLNSKLCFQGIKWRA